MLPILTNYLFVAAIALILLLGLLSALRPFIWWLFGTGRIIEQNDEMIKLLKYIAANKQPPTA